MALIINAIFAGTWGLTAALLVVQLLRLELNSKPVIIDAMRNLLLFGSSVYLLKTGIDVLQIHMSSASTRFWMTFLAWPLAFGVLPQLLWLKPLRHRLASLAVIVALWTITISFVPWAFPQWVTNMVLHPTNVRAHVVFSFTGYLEMVAIYAAMLAGVYYVLTRANMAVPLHTEKALTAETANTAEAA